MCFGTVSVELSSSYDTYLVVPASNSTSRLLEIDHIETWAAENNLMLNHSKSKEIIFTARGNSTQLNRELRTQVSDTSKSAS